MGADEVGGSSLHGGSACSHEAGKHSSLGAEGSSGPDSHQPGLSPTEGDIPPTPQLLTAASRRTTEVSFARRGQWTPALPHGPQSTPLPFHLEYVKQAFVPSSVP